LSVKVESQGETRPRRFRETARRRYFTTSDAADAVKNRRSVRLSRALLDGRRAPGFRKFRALRP
jgi:hypothetical protein